MKKVDLFDTELNLFNCRAQSSLKKRLSAEKCRIAICLTLYNEAESLLRPSLESIVRSLDFLGHRNPHYQWASIYILADGSNHLSDSAQNYLDSLLLERFDDVLEGFEGEIGARELHASQSAEELNRRTASQMAISLRLISKTENAGKLDSHWWFYERICPSLNPDYCFQVDAGTVLEPNAFEQMCAVLDADPQSAGLASNVMIAPPEDGNLLECFQCGDFAVQKTVRWPSEVFSGFLSVIPGQFSGVRWKAFSEAQAADHGSPKDRYLRGQSCRNATERMMYLSEDRIMGFELATEREAAHRLDFAPKAECHTDACDTISELLHQRRRWLNGSLFCRSWMIGKIFEIFADRTQKVSSRIRFAPTLLNLSVQHLLEWFLPLLNILLLAVTWQSLTSLMSPPMAGICFTALAGIWFSPTVLALSGIIQRLSQHQVQVLLQLVKTAFFAIIATNIISLAQNSNSLAYLYYLSMPLALTTGAFVGAAISNRTLLGHLKSSVLTFISLAPSVWLMLSSYAFFNLHDGSWGTKGLCQTSTCKTPAGKSFEGQFKRLRFGIVSAWLASNAILAVVLLQSGYIGIALTLAASLQIVMIATGLAGVISTKVKQSDFSLMPLSRLANSYSLRFAKAPVRRARDGSDWLRRT